MIKDLRYTDSKQISALLDADFAYEETRYDMRTDAERKRIEKQKKKKKETMWV